MVRAKFQILDADYILANSKPTIRLFGKTDDDKTITVFHDKFMPYFYVLPKEGKEERVKDFLKSKFKDLITRIEAVKKFLPIGYVEKPVKMLKITLNNPARVPEIRDSLMREPSVKEVFEADILFRYRFMTDHGIRGMGWYQVEGNSTNTRSVKTQLKVVADSFKELDVEENVKFRYMSVDIEVKIGEEGLPNAEKDDIILMSMFFYPAFKGKNTLVLAAKPIRKFNKDTMGFESEKEMLKEFVRIVDEYDPDIILGYNVTGFDLPFIETRLRKNKIPRTIGRCDQKPLFNRRFGNKYRSSITGRIVVDVYALVKEAATKFGLFRGLKRYGLGDVAKLVLDEDKVDVPHSEINSRWNDDGKRLEKLLDYSRKDAELPFKILLKKRMLDKFFEISKVSGILPQDAIDGGETSRIENLVLEEFNKRNYVVPCRPTQREVSKRRGDRRTKGLKGAFVLKPKVGFHDNCVLYLDYKSMYPSIIISFNICPSTFVLDDEKIESIETPSGSRFIAQKVKRGIIPEIVDYLIKTRDVIKKEMRGEKDPQRRNYLYAKQYAFKTIANAFYGYSGYVRAKLYVLDIANAITSAGRNFIKQTKRIVESKTPYKVVYADTDSVMVKLKTKDLDEALKIGGEITTLINEGIRHILKMKIESIFKTLVILSKKRYAGWSFEPVDDGWSETLIMKGIETVRRDWCDLVSETLDKVLNSILKEQDVDKSIRIVRDVMNQIESGKMDINKLVITKSISKSLHTYKGIQPHIELVKKMRRRDPASAPGVGDRVGFVITKGLGMISKRAEDPEYVKKHGLMVDSKYYIESQLLPPLERVFEALKVNKSDLIGIGKQLGLLEAMKNGIEPTKPSLEEFLIKIDGFICNGCNATFRRVPLSGKCNVCDGEIVFYKDDKRSRVYDPWKSQTLTS